MSAAQLWLCPKDKARFYVAGLDAAGNILRSAVAAASGAAAAAGERLKGLLPGSQESQPLPSIDIPESVGQGAIVAGML